MGRRSTARRRLAGAGLSTATSELHTESQNSKTGFPPGMTVDELRWYSRRRTNDASRRPDNLYPESGSLKDITSEYTRCFKAPPVATHSLGDLTDNKNGQQEKIMLRRSSSQSENFLNKFNEIGMGNKRNRRPRPQHLKLEGDMLFQTENGDEFIEYVLEKRPDLLRRATNLKLEGTIDTTTESQEKFIVFDRYQRLPLIKRDSNLHLEGDHTYNPEYRELFVDFPRSRPQMKRPRPWLHVETEGKMNTDTETISQFIEHSMTDRSEIQRRPGNLKCEGDFSLVPEYRDSFREYPSTERRYSIRQTPSIQLGDLSDRVLLPKILNNLDGDQLNLNSPSGLNMSTDNTAKAAAVADLSKNKFKSDPNHKISYTKSRSSTPVEERLAARPPRASRTRTQSQTSESNRRDYQNKDIPSRIPDNHSEQPQQYTNIYETRRGERMKEPKYLVDDALESQPEYRKAYLDYLLKEKLPRRSSSDKKTLSRIGSPETKKVEENHLSNYNSGLNIYQPTLRRDSATSLSSTRRRSASPSYKLQVTNVDEPKKGFAARSDNKNKIQNQNEEKPQVDGNIRISSRANWIKNITQNKQNTSNYDNSKYDNKSFVVLDSFNENRKLRRKIDSPWWRASYN